MDTMVDLLQIKIDKARAELPEESRNAIDAVDWKKTILEMRAEKGYSFTQLEDLETETELLLCGLINSDNYPKELEKRMNIPKTQADELVKEMNEKVFMKIREELVKNIEKKKPIENIEEMPEQLPVTNNELQIEKKEPENTIPADKQNKEISSVLTQKLSGSFQTPVVETNHSLDNISKSEKTSYPGNTDPYRLPPE